MAVIARNVPAEGGGSDEAISSLLCPGYVCKEFVNTPFGWGTQISKMQTAKRITHRRAVRGLSED